MSEMDDAPYSTAHADAGDRARVAGDAAPYQIPCETDYDCPLLESTCDSGGLGLVYYTNPYCASGFCLWTRHTTWCVCSRGGCTSFSTAGGLANLPAPVCVPPTCSGCASCVEDCECRSLDASACAAECSEAGMDGSAVDGDADGAAGAAAVIECTDLDASKCQPPPSRCIDANTLGYFANNSCVEGHCAWERKSIACPCVGGVCQSTTPGGGT